MTSLTDQASAAPSAPAVRAPVQTPWLLVGGIAIATCGVAAGMAWRPDSPAPVDPLPRSAVAAEAAATPARAHDALVADAADTGAPRSQPGPARRAPPPARHAAPAADTTPLGTQHAAVCATCGTVEGVRSVQKQGQATGLGAVAGGVAGAALGNQIGKGNGRAAMTVLGAVGGGFAGNEVEKRVRAETVYEVRVRMDDGTLRTVTQKTAPAPGARVTVEGGTLRSTRAPQGEGAMVRTAGGA